MSIRRILLSGLSGLLLAGPAVADVVITNADYNFYLHESGRLAVIEMSSAEYQDWFDGAIDSGDIQAMCQRVYNHLDDVYDFIFLVNDNDDSVSGYSGKHFLVQNDIVGLGKPIFDNTGAYGSAGALQSAIHLRRSIGIRGGPSLHELMHRWANSLDMMYDSGSHWGFSSVGGQLGGWTPGTLQDLGGGLYDADGPLGTWWSTFVYQGNSVPYAPLELYLMGLVATNAVTNVIRVADGGVQTDYAAGEFTATNIRTFTIGELVATNQPRNPSVATSQKDFRTLTVILTDTALSATRGENLSEDVRLFSLNGSDGSSLYNFWEATGGLGTMQMDDIQGSLLPGNDFLLILEASELDVWGPEGGPVTPSGINYTITNSFGSAITWTGRTSVAWLELTPSQGVLAAGATARVSVVIGPDAASLPDGTHAGRITLVNTSNEVGVTRGASIVVQKFQELPFQDGFETGTFGTGWRSTGTFQYRNTVSSSYGPHGGTYHMILDDSVGDTTYSRNEMTLGVNLENRTNVTLRFWIMEDGDENHGPPPNPFQGDATTGGGADVDAVVVSADGTNWYLAQNLWNYSTNYVEQEIDIDAVAASNGLTYSARWYIRFNHYDNYAMGYADGFAIDDISVTADWVPGSGAIGILETDELSAVGRAGGPFSPTGMVYTLTNDLGVSLVWTSEVSDAWLGVSPGEGTIPAGGTATVTVGLTDAADALGAGEYSAEVRFINVSNGYETVLDASLLVETFALIPFTETFESGVLEPYWRLSGTADYRTEIQTAWSPHGGARHLIMDDAVDAGDFSRNETTLGVNLRGYTNVVLTFWAQDHGDEAHPLLPGGLPAPHSGGADYDGVAISTNNTTWHPIVDLRNMVNTNYTQFVVDLDAHIATQGLDHTARFWIRFNHYDNWGVSADMGASDGISLDDITIVGDLIDSDGDDIPDYYEEDHGLNPNDPDDADDDPDGDGANNLDEYIADTVPTNGASVLAIVTLQIGSNVVVSVDDTSQDRRYGLETTTNLSDGPWVDLVTNIVGSGGSLEMVDTNSPVNSSFYRVRAERP